MIWQECDSVFEYSVFDIGCNIVLFPFLDLPRLTTSNQRMDRYMYDSADRRKQVLYWQGSVYWQYIFCILLLTQKMIHNRTCMFTLAHRILFNHCPLARRTVLWTEQINQLRWDSCNEGKRISNIILQQIIHYAMV